MLAGVVVTTQLGVQATVFYLAVYLFMNLAAFAVIVVRERESDLRRRHLVALRPRRDRPLLAWPMTIAMLALAGFPATAGFFGKIYLIEAAVGQRLRLARRRDRARLGDLARLLPARRRGGVDALARGRRRRRATAAGRGRRSPAARPRRTTNPSPSRPSTRRLASPRSSASACSARRRRSSSGSTRAPCWTWRTTPGPRSRSCSSASADSRYAPHEAGEPDPRRSPPGGEFRAAAPSPLRAGRARAGDGGVCGRGPARRARAPGRAGGRAGAASRTAWPAPCAPASASPAATCAAPPTPPRPGCAPCTTRERFRRQETTVDVAVVRFGGEGEWRSRCGPTAPRRSRASPARTAAPGSGSA